MLFAAWLVHAYTASGIVLAFLAARAVIDFDYRTAFFWLWVQVVVDATDGLLARRARVRERIPFAHPSRIRGPQQLLDDRAPAAVAEQAAGPAHRQLLVLGDAPLDLVEPVGPLPAGLELSSVDWQLPG